MVKKAICIYLMLCMLFLLPLGNASALEKFDCAELDGNEWLELRSRYGALIYPADHDLLVITIANRLLSRFDQLYEQIHPLYETDLDLPITLRFYPDPSYFSCYNPQTPNMLDSVWMSAVGSREVAFNAEKIQEEWSSFTNRYENVLLFEIGYLFGRQITDNKAPLGLLFGVAGYMQIPDGVMEALGYQAEAYVVDMDTSWRKIWEADRGRESTRYRLAGTSIVAYLVDAYGWQQFLVYLNDIRITSSYRESLSKVYKSDFSRLEAQWRNYYSYYLTERWNAHVLYNFDLSTHRRLVEGGAYIDAEQLLLNDIEFLKKTGQSSRVREAQGLLIKSREGQAAAEVVLDARRALLDGRYEESVLLIQEAKARYLDLQDKRREVELEKYWQWAQEVLDIRVETGHLMMEKNVIDDNLHHLLLELNVREQRLVQLGDVQTAEAVSAYIQTLLEKQEPPKQNNDRLGTHLMWIVGLVILRFLVLVRKTPIETSL
jgi:hypothetical protein